MQNDWTYITKQMTLKIAGNIKPGDNAILDELIATRQDVKEEWDRVIADLDPADRQTYFARYEMLDWMPVSEITRKERSGSSRNILIAASLVGVLALGLTWIFTNRQEPATAVAGIPASPKGISLTLANGQQISLSATGDTLSLAGARLNNSGNALSFQANGPAGEGINHLAVPVGMTYRLVLPDGSSVWLNSNSEIDFPFAFNNTRAISIKGEAYLEITPDATRPFVVKTGDTEVEVLGTSFNINAYDEARVALVSGKVNVRNDKGALLLQPGEESIADAQGRLIKHAFDADETLAWRKGLYYFNNVKLQDMMPVLTRMYGMEIKIDNQSLHHTTFSGMANRNKPVRIFLENLKKTAAVDYYISADSTLHFK